MGTQLPSHDALNGPSHDALNAALAFIPIFEEGVFENASSVYITTGEYPLHVKELLSLLTALEIQPDGFDWMSWIDQARPYLQDPKKISEADAEAVSRLTALAVQSDRFNKSLFPHLCSSGVLHQLLLRLRTLCA
jgi:hypothetical protein